MLKEKTVTLPPASDRSTPPVPPPGCPAHGLGTGRQEPETWNGYRIDELTKLYGDAHDTNPMALYEALRQQYGAVAPVLVPGGRPAWLVLDYRENVHVARTPSVFSRDSREWNDPVPPDHPLAPLTAWQPNCVFLDGRDHERLRAAVTQSLQDLFKRRGIARYVTRNADKLIDQIEARGEGKERGQVDLVAEFAEQLPLRVITQIFGIPEDYYGPALAEAVRDVISGSETATASDAVLSEALQDLVERSRASPQHDLTSKLIQHPNRLTDDEVREQLRLIMVASHQPTVNLLADTLEVILTDAQFRSDARATGTLPDALQGVLWDKPPLTTNTGRWALGDTHLGGQPIGKGDMLVLCLAAGNHDPDILPDQPGDKRGNRSHIAYSVGPHECPGLDVSQVIVTEGCDRLLQGIPDLRLAVPKEELRRVATLRQWGLASLPAEYEIARVAMSRPRRPASAKLPPQRQPTPAPAPPPAQDVPQNRPTRAVLDKLQRLMRGA